MAVTIFTESHIASFHRNERAVVIVDALSFQQVIGLGFSMVFMVAQSASWFESDF